MIEVCPNFSSQEYKDLASALGDAMAMNAFDNNGGTLPDFTKAPNGEESTLYKELEDVKGKTGAFKDKYVAYTPEFKSWFGDFEYYHYLDNKESRTEDEGRQLEYLKEKFSGKIDSNYEPLSTYIDRYRRSGTQYQRSSLEDIDPETLADMSAKSEILRDYFDLDVVLDPDIDVAGQLSYDEQLKPIISINPNYAQKDTVFHEGGHLYIDLLGGLNDPVVREGVNMLKGSQLEEELRGRYPDLRENDFNKELLATAIGREATEIFDNRKKDLIGRFNEWINGIFERLKEMLGLPVNRARQLARELNTGRLREFATVDAAEYAVREQRRNMEESIHETRMKRKEEFAKDAKNRVERRLKEVNEQIRAAEEAKEVETRQKQIENLQKLLNEMSEADSDQRLAYFLRSASEEVRALEEKFDDLESRGVLEDSGTRNKFLKLIKEKIDTYSDISRDIERQLNRDEQLAQILDQKGILASVTDTVQRLDRIEAKYFDWSHEHAARTMAKVGGRVHAKYREEYRKEFERQYRPKKKKMGDSRYFEERRKYVQNKMANNSEQIQEEELQFSRDILLESTGDISGLSAWAASMKNISDDVVQRAVEMLDIVEYYNMRDLVEEYKNADDLYQRFEKEKPQTDMKRKYEEILEDSVDDNASKVLKDNSGNREKSRYMVGRFYSRFYHKKSELWREYYRLKDENPEVAPSYWANTVKPWLDKNAYRTQEGEWLPQNHWKNPQYDRLQELRSKGSAIAEVYDYLINLAEKRDENIPDQKELGRKIPGVQKNNIERMGSNGFFKGLADEIRDTFGVDPGDVQEYGNVDEEVQERFKDQVKDKVRVATDKTGQEKMSIPIPFRTNLPERQQSYDLMSIQLLDYYFSLNYKRKAPLITDLNSMMEMMEQRKVQSRTPLNFFKVDDTDYVWKKGGNTNAYHVLNSIIEDRVYGIKTKGDPKMAEILSGIRNYASKMMLVGNYGVGGTTFLQGKLMNWIEGFSGEFFGVPNARKAANEYWKEMRNGAIVADFGRRRWYSKTNLVIEKFDVLTDWWPVTQRFVDDTRAKQLFKSSTLHATHTSAEHHIQAVTAMSVMDNKKVKDKDGNYLTEKGTTSSREEGMSLLDAYNVQTKEVNGEQVNTGRLRLDERVSSIEGYEGSEISEAEALVSREIKTVNMTMYGNYDKNNQSMAQRNMWLDQMYFLRGWLVPGIIKRWRGFSQIVPFKSIRGKEYDQDEMFFNRALGRFEEGAYVTGFRFLGNLMKSIKDNKYDFQTKWGEMSDHERANTIRFFSEAASMALMLGIASLLYRLGDMEDEDDGTYYYTGAYFARRLYNELTFFWNVGSAWRILQSPAATMSMVERAYEFLAQVTTNPLERYERTDREGQLKVRKDLEDLFGIGYNQLTRDIKQSLDYLYTSDPSAAGN